MADDQRAGLIRDLDQAARYTASHAAHMSRLFRSLMQSENDGLSAADAVDADNAIASVMRELPEVRRIFAKYARLLDGPPPPRLAIRANAEPDRLGIIAPYPSGDLDVGEAERTGDGERPGWRIRLTDHGQVRSSIGLCWDAAVDELLDAVNRHMDEHGPWWATP